ncbi:lipoate--protein ligase family protein [Stieleria sp. JC731]|uniref:lipoate--protein ligase family protein n=1 Tax=Pirellulaceae TaxID=2691357 RepID=UPI001E3FF912|nr:lipoate--protein ligase family protein [Stieleria sp. JC731]MCC9599135.1 lipoate--protein ligase family protein [Stieleria sp. JC731]
MKRIVIKPAEEAKLSLPTYQLAIDEASLVAAEAGELGPSFRTWELNSPTVILGRSSKINLETDREFCRQEGIGIFRRCSGGASIVAGPGCMMYSVVLSLDEHPQAAKIDQAHQIVMSRVHAAVARQLADVSLQGTCDLTFGDRKFSGNALRVGRRHLLYHGTILYAADVALLQRCLEFAPRQPDYRAGRNHGAFVTNVAIDPAQLDADLAKEFEVVGEVDADQLSTTIDRLVSERYGEVAWHERH